MALKSGRLLCSFRTNTNKRGKQDPGYPGYIHTCYSDDGGKSWSDTSWLLRAAPNGNQGYSSSVEVESGRIFTACYAQNKDGVTGITGTFWNLPPK